MTEQLRIYIAGPMRGYENDNFPEFYKAEKELNYKRVFKVINPARLDDEINKFNGYVDYKEAMKRDIDEIFKVDALYMLSGWERSEGARVEHALGVYLGLLIMYQ